MQFDYAILDDLERITFALRTLYLRRGYARYRLGRFEEYDFYSRNKDFLISESIITFSDTNGKLMALKPDVTLAILKNHPDRPDRLLKLCYNENVYRVSRSSGCFREIPQTGLECIGPVDESCLGEVLSLAAESLAVCGKDYLLEVTHLDILSAFVEDAAPREDLREALLDLVSQKNLHGIRALCRENCVPAEKAEALASLLELTGSPETVFPGLEALCRGRGLEEELRTLRLALDSMDAGADRVELDFSAVGNMRYYNGIIFRGFLPGVPGSVLSGGQYDRLMGRLRRRSGAVGFAVYLDMLQSLEDLGEEADPC